MRPFRFSNTSSSSSDSQYSQEDEAVTHPSSSCETTSVSEQCDRRKVEFTLHQDSKSAPTLDDLSKILHLRGQLQEMGTTFTAEGEMLTYGNPPMNEDLEQMIRLGAMYDVQWNSFFTGKDSNGGSGEDLWQDLKVLKRMLQNENIVFGDQHKRSNYGSSHPKLIRLSDQYDVLREEWHEKTVQNLRPRHPSRHRVTQEKAPQTPKNLGWKFIFDDENVQANIPEKDHYQSNRLTVVVEERPLSANPGLAPENREVGHPSSSESSPSISYRPGSSHAYPDSTPQTAPDTTISTHSRGLTIDSPTTPEGLSSLQDLNTASVSFRSTCAENLIAGSIRVGVEDRRDGHARMMTMLLADGERRANVTAVDQERKDKEKKKEKGLRKWLRAVLGGRKTVGNVNPSDPGRTV
ncbi:hypothetical protein N0V94_008029 [Neodidymelliopsis sp. IMI 364377]|nr:hypothetical protein N0V94_008029 [Neodidymelliopsis sp. IMI 364377]